jgi:dihydropteroate synthase
VHRIAEETGKPVLIGASRKRFIHAIDERAADAGRDRIGGSVAAALLAAQNGAAMVRVHDVAETVQALKVWRATQA